MHQFDEHHAEFKGFSERFEREVRPDLTAQDGERQTAVRRGVASAIFLTVLGFAVAAYVWLKMEYRGPVWIALPALLGPFSGYIAYVLFTHDIRSQTKTRIVDFVMDYIGWQFRPTVLTFGIMPFNTHFLLPRYDRSSFEDGITGDAHGASFEAVEAHLEKRTRDSKGRTRWTTVFRGQLMRLDFPTKTFGRTIVLRDAGWFNRKKKGDMKRIGLADPVFEKAFEAYGTDQVEARVILDPAFMQRMVDLEQSVEGKKIRFAFADNDLFIAVETRNRYEAGSMFKPLDDPERAQRIMDEVGAILDIVDGLVAR